MLITPQETFLSLDDAALALGCDPETVRALAANATLPGAKVGRAWIFLASDLAAYCRSKMHKKAESWGSTSAVTSGGQTSRSTGTGLVDRLKQARSRKRSSVNVT